MRLMRITTNSQLYLTDFHRRRPEQAAWPYRRQHAALLADCFGWADFWGRALAPLGYEAWEPVSNARPQQEAWAREQGVAWAENTWLWDITRAQVRHYAPEVLLVNDFQTFSRGFLDDLRRDCPSLRLILGWCGAPYQDPEVFKGYDVVLSCIPSVVADFRRQGHDSRLLRHAFAPQVAELVEADSPREVAFAFLGSLVHLPNAHRSRVRLLEFLARDGWLEIWGDAYAAGRGGCTRPLEPADPQDDVAPEYRIPLEFLARLKPGLWGLDMYRCLARSQVVLNNHIDLAGNHASNMRLFEATGMGACLLTEAQPDLGLVFAPEVEVATYQSPEEAREKASWLLAHEPERRALARAGQQKTLTSHTFAERAPWLDQIIREKLGGRKPTENAGS
ncbi:MAG: glycosyltransferase [Deltaproteobacteria bacterium]|nr:glycosyltransferase [Deltaproteobacteria bacterium]